MEYTSIILGGFGGVGWSLVRFYREHQKNPKITFDPKKFGKTLIEGLLVGFVAGFYGMEFDMVTSLGIYGSLTGIADTVVNIIWGFIKK